ncbi:hypothetical protein JXA47_15235 [Candidatus Sumerlaeota bacterium]|nr:hypothetical protein [Candidatus Sumerlaeota bacterium]
MNRLIACLSLALALGGSAPGQPTDPQRAVQLFDALALGSQATITPEEIAAAEQRINETQGTDPELAVTLLTSLANQDALSDPMRELAGQIAQNPMLDLSMRRQALTAMGELGPEITPVTTPDEQAVGMITPGVSIMPYLTAQLLADPELGAMAQSVFYPPRIFAYRVDVEPPLRDGCTIIIHGTLLPGIGGRGWWQPGGGFEESLNDWVGNVWRIVADGGTRTHEFEPFAWEAGRPTSDSIRAGGTAIAESLEKVLIHAPPPIDIIAHSHGANVVVIALADVLAEHPELRVRRLIFLAAPHIHSDGRLIHWPQSPDHPLYGCYDQIINIYAPEDRVATTIAASFAWGDATRDLRDFDIPRTTDISVETSVGFINAHSVLHSNDMANRIGSALCGEIPWETSSFPPITDARDVGEELFP